MYIKGVHLLVIRT